MFLDDLQWLDSATLDLLEHLSHALGGAAPAAGRGLSGQRGRSVTPTHAHARGDPRGRCEGARDRAGAARASTMSAGSSPIPCIASRERARPLAQLVHEKTGGNPFFAIQFLTALADEGLLAFDSVAAAWAWDIDRIRRQGLHRQRGGPHGPETEAVVDHHAGCPQAPRLPG